MKKAKKMPKMIEVNLIPDIKQEVLTARQTRDRVATLAIVVSAAVVSVAIILSMITFIIQGLIIGSQKNQIEDSFKKFANYPGSSSILTIQKQLEELEVMHGKKPITSRMFIVLTQIISKYKLDIKISQIDIDPHKKNMVLEGYSETGYVELERFIKTLDNASVSYADIAKINEVNNSATEKEANEALKKALDEAGQVNLMRQEVSLLGDPSLADNSEGKRVLTFKIGLPMNEKFFLANDKLAVIKGASYRDVTDSYLSVPQELFGSTNKDNDQKNTDEKTNQAESEEE